MPLKCSIYGEKLTYENTTTNQARISVRQVRSVRSVVKLEVHGQQTLVRHRARHRSASMKRRDLWGLVHCRM